MQISHCKCTHQHRQALAFPQTAHCISGDQLTLNSSARGMTGVPGLLITALVAGPEDGAIWLLHERSVLEEVLQKSTWVDGSHWQS